MTPPQTKLPPQPAAPPRFLPLLLLLFLGSGCAALIYEIVWLQLLQLVIGSSAVSLGLLLGTFMGGMCLGSLALARLIPQHCHPLRVYALLESAMAILGLTVLFAVPALGRLYAPHAGHGLAGILWRGVVASVCLLPPTFLMGATLPAISRWVESTPQGMSWLGLFYGGNTAGAVLGCLLAGFYLLRVFDMATATFVAAAINATVALSAFLLAFLTPHRPPARAENAGPPVAVAGSKLICLAIALSGLCALAAEVIWTRLLSVMLGATVYAFSIILAVFLAGLGLGSMAGSFLARGSRRPELALGWCQVLLAAAMAWAACMLASSLPYWPVNPQLAAASPWYTFQLDLVRCLWALLPATLLWGASFPLALAAVAARGLDPGRLVGKIYAANTLGAIVGALAASLLLIAWIGTQDTQRLLIGLSAASGVVLLLSSFWRQPPGRASGQSSNSAFTAAVVSLVVACLLAGFFVSSVPPVPWQLIAHGRYIATYGNDRTLIYMGEGINASVAVTQMEDGVLNFHISGKIEASTDPQDMRLQRMLGHLPALFNPHPRSILVVGCGAGVTAGSFLTYPGVTNVTICEIEPLIPKKIAPFFKKENYDVVNDPRVRIFFDDARHFVLTSRDKFDIITSDPIHPWVKGAATLYTRDYFQMCRQHLNPGGIVTQWVPLYESDLAAVKSEMATFFNVFPNGTIWNNDDNGTGYDSIVLGTEQPLTINLDQLQARWQRETAAAQSLKDAGFGSIFVLLATYGGQASDLQPWLAGAQINTDRNLRLQYLAGLASDLTQATMISDSFLAYRKFPDNIFTGSEARLDALRLILQAKSKK
ncbi:MAG: fused MFS/spermidine synthase [Verrucomicrobiota bacterium]|jgi:spermidine synthase